MIIQVIAFVLTFACWGIWILAPLDSPAFTDNTWYIPAINSNPISGSQAAVLGTRAHTLTCTSTLTHSHMQKHSPHPMRRFSPRSPPACL